MICNYCGRDLNEIWQDNMSYDPHEVICEDCYREITHESAFDYVQREERKEEEHEND